MKKKIALITGITGQDGSLLTRLLLKKNYEVHGIIRRSSSFNTSRIDDIYQDVNQKKRSLTLHYGDLVDTSNMLKIIENVKPDEIYNLAAQSHVKVSFELPEYTSMVDAIGCLKILEIIKGLKLQKKVKFYQASTSEMFGSSSPPQNENTEFKPTSPYGAAKLYAHWITRSYRESYNIFASTGILFNHEGPYRGDTFVSKKIVKAAVKIKKGKQKKLYLGNLYAKRDWGDAEDYVAAIWKILQQKNPDDFVLATGKSYTIKYFASQTFKKLGMKIVWKGKGLKEKGYIDKKEIIVIDKKYFRPFEVDHLKGDPSKAKRILKWKPSTSLDKLIDKMIEFEIKNFSKRV